MFLLVVLSHLGATAILQLSLSSCHVTIVTLKYAHVCFFVHSKQYMFTFSFLWLSFHETSLLLRFGVQS